MKIRPKINAAIATLLLLEANINQQCAVLADIGWGIVYVKRRQYACRLYSTYIGVHNSNAVVLVLNSKEEGILL